MPRITTSQADDLIVRKNHKIDNKLGWTEDKSFVSTYGESLQYQELTDIWKWQLGDEEKMKCIWCEFTVKVDPQINSSTLEIR